jgi:hypothetical protein
MPATADPHRRLPAIAPNRSRNLGSAGGVYRESQSREAPMPDKSPRKPSSKKVPDKSLKEKRQDKKDKKDGHAGFGGISGRG